MQYKSYIEDPRAVTKGFLLNLSEWYLNLDDLKILECIFWLQVSCPLGRLAIYSFKLLTSNGKTIYEMKDLCYFRQ